MVQLEGQQQINLKYPVTSWEKLLIHPHTGKRLKEFEPRDVGQIQIGQCEMGYEMANSSIDLMRLWHIWKDR